MEIALKCQICGSKSNGVHYGAVTCRPCAEFFRRSMFDKLTYNCVKESKRCNIRRENRRNGCHACRLRRCRLVGMTWGLRKQQQLVPYTVCQNPVQTEKLPIISDNELSKIVKAYKEFVQEESIALYPGISSGNIPNLDHFNAIEAVSNPLLFRMLNLSMEPLAKMENEQKVILFNKVAPFLRILHMCQFTMEQLPHDTNKCQIGSGCTVEIDNYNTEFNGTIHYLYIVRRISMGIKLFKQLPFKTYPEDFCALMAITLCTFGAKCKGQNERWIAYKETILANWLSNLQIRLDSEHAASLMMAKLLCNLSIIIDESNISNPVDQLPKKVTMELALANKDSFNVIQNFITIYDALATLKDANLYYFNYISQFDRIEDILTSNKNILGMATNCKAYSIFEWETHLKMLSNNVEQFSLHPRFINTISLDRLLSVDLAKAMFPHYRQLNLKDQVLLARHLAIPFLILCKTYHSSHLGSQTWVSKHGFPTILLFHKDYSDRRLNQLGERLFTDSVRPFLECGALCPEEMVLLLAILYSHSAILEMSHEGKELQYAQSVHYSRLLLQFVQSKCGCPARGAARFAQCMRLLESVHHSAHAYELFFTYLEAFHIRGDMKAMFPNCIAPLV